MFLPKCLLFIITFWILFQKSLADVVAVTKPIPNAVFDASSGSVDIDVEWMNGIDIDDDNTITKYTLTLCTGTNLHIVSIKALATLSASQASDGSYTINIPNDTCGNGIYFLQIYAQSKAGYTNHYSQRFVLRGMDGSKLAVAAADSNPPTAENVVTTGVASAFTIDTDSFTLPYTKQSGSAKYAPMQLQPGTKVTRTAWTTRFATSDVTYFSTMRKSIDQFTTVTPGWSYTLSMNQNYATPAPMPSLNGIGYDPKERQTFTTRKMNLNKRHFNLI